MRTLVAFRLSFVIGAFFAGVWSTASATGCSGSSSGDIGEPDATAPDANAQDAPTDTTSDDVTIIPPDTGAPDAGECSDKTTRTECRQCCGIAHPAALKVYDALLDTCLCKVDQCEAECASSLCATTGVKPEAGSPCALCVANADSADAGDAGCTAEVRSQCRNDTKCAPLIDCETTAKCPSKN
jgi:hypothetical protein